MSECKHANVEMVNPYEILRKYRCLDCNGLMMCACEYEFGSKFLPHQLGFTVDPQTQDTNFNEISGKQEAHFPRIRSFPL